jgi:hypothetical protein
LLTSQLPCLAAEHPDARLQLWCQKDKALFGQKYLATRVWYEREVHPPGVVDCCFEGPRLFTACSCEADGTFALAMQLANADTVIVVVEHVAQQLARDVGGAVVLDKAVWHDKRALRVLQMITPLPSLKPMERVWLYLVSGISHIACWTTMKRSLRRSAVPETDSLTRKAGSQF